MQIFHEPTSASMMDEVSQPTNNPDPEQLAGGLPKFNVPSAQKLMINHSTFNTYNYTQQLEPWSLTGKSEQSAKQETLKRSNTIYETQLMCKGRGFPLWVPQPNTRLTPAHRAKGVSIGDVGIVTEYGAFDFLFNVCVPPADPMNPSELPKGFETLRLRPWDIREFRDFPNGSYVASPSVGRAVKGDDQRLTTFESSAGEGALLAMPEGAYHEEVNDVSKFREYAQKHVESWYEFVIHHRGRKDTANGDIRLVVGVDKSTAWGIASFSDPFKLQLKETDLDDGMAKKDSPYTWEHMGRSGEVKAGPDSFDNKDIGHELGGGGKIRNQALFVRTLNILLTKDVWDGIQTPKVFDNGCSDDFGPGCGMDVSSRDVQMSDSTPSFVSVVKRVMKRTISDNDSEDETSSRHKFQRLSSDTRNNGVARRAVARPSALGKGIPSNPTYSEKEKKIKYTWVDSLSSLLFGGYVPPFRFTDALSKSQTEEPAIRPEVTTATTVHHDNAPSVFQDPGELIEYEDQLSVTVPPPLSSDADKDVPKPALHVDFINTKPTELYAQGYRRSNYTSWNGKVLNNSKSNYFSTDEHTSTSVYERLNNVKVAAGTVDLWSKEEERSQAAKRLIDISRSRRLQAGSTKAAQSAGSKTTNANNLKLLARRRYSKSFGTKLWRPSPSMQNAPPPNPAPQSMRAQNPAFNTDDDYSSRREGAQYTRVTSNDMAPINNITPTPMEEQSVITTPAGLSTNDAVQGPPVAPAEASESSGSGSKSMNSDAGLRSTRFAYNSVQGPSSSMPKSARRRRDILSQITSCADADDDTTSDRDYESDDDSRIIDNLALPINTRPQIKGHFKAGKGRSRGPKHPHFSFFQRDVKKPQGSNENQTVDIAGEGSLTSSPPPRRFDTWAESRKYTKADVDDFKEFLRSDLSDFEETLSASDEPPPQGAFTFHSVGSDSILLPKPSSSPPPPALNAHPADTKAELIIAKRIKLQALREERRLEVMLGLRDPCSSQSSGEQQVAKPAWRTVDARKPSSNMDDDYGFISPQIDYEWGVTMNDSDLLQGQSISTTGRKSVQESKSQDAHQTTPKPGTDLGLTPEPLQAPKPVMESSSASASALAIIESQSNPRQKDEGRRMTDPLNFGSHVEYLAGPSYDPGAGEQMRSFAQGARRIRRQNDPPVSFANMYKAVVDSLSHISTIATTNAIPVVERIANATSYVTVNMHLAGPSGAGRRPGDELTSKRPIDGIRLGPRKRIRRHGPQDRSDAERVEARSSILPLDETFETHPSLAINSWILGSAGLPSSVRMVITHDSAWYTLLLEDSLSQAHQMRTPIDRHEFQADNADTLQSLYDVCVSNDRDVMYLEPKERHCGEDTNRDCGRIDALVQRFRSNGAGIQEYLFGSLQAGSHINYRRSQIEAIKARISNEESQSTTLGSLKPLDFHPARPITLNVLLQVIRGEITSSSAFSMNTVAQLRDDLRSLNDHDAQTSTILPRLSNVLLNRALEFSEKDSVEEAISYYRYLEPVIPRDSYQYLEVIMGLSMAHYYRYQMLRMREDLDSLFKYLDIQSNLNYATMLQVFSLF